MSRAALRHLGAEPFADAAEVWFWYWSVRRARAAGWTTPRTVQAGRARPCEVADVLRPIDQLVRRGELRDAHLRVLRVYGEQQREPVFGHTPAEDHDAALWRAALAPLERYWRSAGIIG